MGETGLTGEGQTPHEHGEHDHDSCERGAIAHAEAVSAAAGLRFTEQRRKVLAALAESHVPASAYEVIDRLAREGPRPAPVSVYRALEFLVENGFAHRIESRNAYVACSRGQGVPGAADAHGHGHGHRHGHGHGHAHGHDHAHAPHHFAHDGPIVFLLCEACGAAAEASSPELPGALQAIADAASFAPRAPVIEIRGLCARCRQAA